MASSTASLRIAHVQLQYRGTGSSVATDDGDPPATGQEAVSSQNMANAIENLSRTRREVTGSRMRQKDGERLYPKSWSSNTPLGGFAREVSEWLKYVDPKHEAGN